MRWNTEATTIIRLWPAAGISPPRHLYDLASVCMFLMSWIALLIWEELYKCLVSVVLGHVALQMKWCEELVCFMYFKYAEDLEQKLQ